MSNKKERKVSYTVYEGRRLTPNEFGHLISLPKEKRDEQFRNLQVYGEFK